MQVVTVGQKYQIVIPKEVRKKMKGLKPGNKVSVHSVDKETLTIKIDPQNWAKRTKGIMKDAWKNIDPIAELEKIRSQW